MKNKPIFIMLIGVPASGKSTAIKNLQKSYDFVVLSTDDYIEKIAQQNGSTYNDVFQSTIKEAEANLQKELTDAIANQSNIIWDQTNLTVKNRKAKLQKIPDNYQKLAIFFATPEEQEWNRRLNSRPGKNIPPHVLKSMNDNIMPPDLEEGFDDILEMN